MIRKKKKNDIFNSIDRCYISVYLSLNSIGTINLYEIHKVCGIEFAYPIKKRNVSATGSKSQKSSRGGGKANRFLIKCIEFRLNYFCTCLDEFNGALRCMFFYRVLPHLSIEHTEHGSTSRSWGFSVEHEYVWNVVFFSFAASLVNTGRGSDDDRGPMCRFINETAETDLDNLLSFETNNLNTIFSLTLFLSFFLLIQYQSRMELKSSPGIDTSRHFVARKTRNVRAF